MMPRLFRTLRLRRPASTVGPSDATPFMIGVATASMLVVGFAPLVRAQSVKDGSDAVLGQKDTQTILALVRGHIGKEGEPKVTELRRSKGSIVCGSVNVKGKDGRYLGERGFVADVAALTFGRLPEGVELLDPRAVGYKEKEQVRESYFDNCMD